MPRTQFYLALTAVSLMTLGVQSCFAFDGDNLVTSRLPPELRKGMYSYEVIQNWGPSTDKIEYETKRQERWNYGKGHVLFFKARVKSWDVGIGALAKAAPSEQKQQGQKIPAYSTSPQARELLGEILREIPSGQPDSSSSTPPVGSVGGAEIRAVRPSEGLIPPDVMIE